MPFRLQAIAKRTLDAIYEAVYNAAA